MLNRTETIEEAMKVAELIEAQEASTDILLK